jgi:hypothetical protein
MFTGRRFRGWGWTTPAHYYLLRPDGHIGYRADGTDLNGLGRYLARCLPNPSASMSTPGSRRRYVSAAEARVQPSCEGGGEVRVQDSHPQSGASGFAGRSCSVPVRGRGPGRRPPLDAASQLDLPGGSEPACPGVVTSAVTGSSWLGQLPGAGAVTPSRPRVRPCRTAGAGNRADRRR